MNRPENTIFSPKELRDRARAEHERKCLAIAAERSAVMRAALDRAAIKWRASISADITRAIARYRDNLPEHRRGWFDTLSESDQKRLALYPDDGKTNLQRYYEGTSDGCWPEC